MKYFNSLFVLLTLILGSTLSYGQNISNKGKEFWVGYGHHQYMEPPTCSGGTPPNTMNMVLYLSAEEPAIVTVTIDSSGPFPATWWKRTYNIAANTVITTENLPKGTINAGASGSDPNFDARLVTDPPPAGTGGEGIFRKKGIHIESNVPIVAYAHIYGSVSSGATMLLPVETWGYTYTSLNQEQGGSVTGAFSWSYVMAKEDNTRIRITPSANSRLGKSAGVPFTVDLQRGQIYQLIATADCNTGAGPELTGTTIQSIIGPDGQCHKIAAFSGSSRTGGESLAPCASGSRDNDMQQNFPEQTWGKRYLTTPFSFGSTASSLQTSTFKVVVLDPTTVVRKNGVVLSGLINNKYYRFTSNTADLIEGNKPILVGQYMSGTTSCNGGLGDPEMVYLSPIEQAIKRVGCFRNTREAITVNYVTLAVPTSGVPSLRIDGSTAFSHSYPHPNAPGYTVVIKRWTATPSQVLIDCDSAFTGITYGLGGAESYGYNVGTYLNNLNAISGLHNLPDTTNGGTNNHEFNCVNTPVKISALMRYQPTEISWNLSSLGAAISPNTNFVMNPASNYYFGTVVDNGITYYRYTLPGSYLFSGPGTFNIPITATSIAVANCSNTEDLNLVIEVKPSPSVNFNIFRLSDCSKDTIYFTNSVTPGYTIAQRLWTLPGNITTNTADAKVLVNPGTYSTTLYIATTEGCAATETKFYTVAAPPTTVVAANPSTVCLGQSISLSATSSYTGSSSTINSWYWDLGNGTTLNPPNGNPISVTYSSPNTYIVKHVVGISQLCVSDTASKTVVVSPRAITAITYPTGCVPASGVAQFGTPNTDLGGQTILSWNWNFGDPNANGSNPNTSTQQNPTHTYTVFGTYTVTLSITTAQGCTGDSAFSINMNLRPALAYGPLNPVCENAAPVSVAQGSVTNGVQGTSEYHGPGTTQAGMFDPAVAGYGTHTIWFVFTTTGGCIDSVSQTILVRARPRPAFTYPNGVCLPTTGFVQFTNSTTIPDGQGITYSWLFNDPNANAGNPNTSNAINPSHNFGEGNYNIKLTATSANGCVADTTISVNFKVTPQLSFSPLSTVCESVNGTISVANGNVLNGVTGSGVYSGTATTPAGNFTPSAAGFGTHTIWYVFTSAGGCKDSVSQTILVRAKPNVSFTFPFNSCLSVTGFVQMSNTTTIGDGQTLSYQWNFGDPNANAGNPNTSTLTNPSHNYGEGTFNIQLIANTPNGCTASVTYTADFKVTPQLAFSPLPTVCQSSAGTISVATASVLNNLTGTGVYSGPGTDASGNFNPSVAGFGTHNITYTFTSAGGCIASISQTITVNPKPNVGFTFPTGICLTPSGLVQFNNTTTVSGGGVMTYTWDFNDPNANAGNLNTSTQQNPSHIFREGTYNIKLSTTSAGCTADTTITAVFKITPQINYPPLQNVCQSFVGTVSVGTASVTNIVTGTGSYSGPGTDATGNFSPSVAGFGTHTITYTFTTTGGCTASVSQPISVTPAPVPVFSFPVGTCLPTSGLVQFVNTTFVPGGGTLAYAWDFNDPNANAGNPNTSTQTNPTHIYKEGTYNIKLTASAVGCSKDTTITAVFKIIPQLSFNALSPVCENVAGTISVATASVQNSVTGNGIYSGPGTDASGNFSPSVAGYGTHTITYTFTTTGGCTASVSSTILVRARPRTNFSYPLAGCLPSNGTVQFTNGTTIPDGQTLTYLWNFGDPFANGGNPNTSTLINPSHNFSEGTFNIKLTATTPNGCTFDTTVTAALKVTPVLAYAPIPSICQSGSSISVANGSVLNNVTGTGIYSGPGTNAAGMLDPNAAGAGTHIITYTYTSTGGCTSSVTQTIKVHPKPVGAFSLNNNSICLNQSVTITNSSTISIGNITTWNWDFGDGSNLSKTNGNAFTRTYTTFGNYNIKLVAISDSGCISDPLTQTVGVHALPSPNFGMPSGVCMPNGTATFNNLSTIADNAGLSYSWDFGDGSTSSATNVSHVYSFSSPVQVTLSVTSSFGCLKDTVKTFSAFFEKPVANGNIAPSVLCQGVISQFQDMSTAQNSTIKSWMWIFGDGSMSNVQSPAKKYLVPGTYNVSLIVTNAADCISDTFKKTVVVNLQPVIDAGPSFIVPQGTTIQLQPYARDSSVLNFIWSPPGDFLDPTLLRPILVATRDQTYTLIATGSGNCIATDMITVKILKPVKVPNAFSPNGDGINDTWVLSNLIDYPGAGVEVFNRYGQVVYSVSTYSNPWDGAYNGKPLPFGVYYYVITLRNGFKPLTGSVTIIR